MLYTGAHGVGDQPETLERWLCGAQTACNASPRKVYSATAAVVVGSGGGGVGGRV